MTYRVVITKKATKAIQALPATARHRVADAILALAEDPRPAGCKKLVGADQWRIRVGDYRILYMVSDGELLVTVVRVAHRREVYR